MKTRSGRGLGWQRDYHDQRDVDACMLLGLSSSRAKVPDHVDLRDSGFMPPVWNQFALGSCTANSIAANLEFAAAKNGKDTGTPSRLFIYYHERLMEGTVMQDAGAQIRDGFKVIAKIGVPPETEWPYEVAKFAVKPPQKAEQDAKNQRALSYYRILNLGGILDALAAGHCVSFGFVVYESFENTGKDGVVALPVSGEQVEGGHAVLAVGYDAKKKLMLVRNSWGMTWGDGGYCWMPFQFWGRGYCSDFWCCEVAS